VAVDEAKIERDGYEVYARGTIDCETLEVRHIDVSPGRSSPDALLSLRDTEGIPGTPVVWTDLGRVTGRWNSSVGTSARREEFGH